MLMPKRTKYRRVQRGRMKGAASRGNKIAYGEFGIQAMEPGWITGNQIEAARIAMTRYIKRGGQVWIKIFPDKPVTAKPAETRMGSGKGSPEYWVAVVKPGRMRGGEHRRAAVSTKRDRLDVLGRGDLVHRDKRRRHGLEQHERRLLFRASLQDVRTAPDTELRHTLGKACDLAALVHKRDTQPVVGQPAHAFAQQRRLSAAGR